MNAGKLGLLSVALVLGLSACNLLDGGTEPTDPTDPGTPSGGPGTPSGGPGTPGTPLPVEGGFGVSTSATGDFLFSGGDGGNITSDSDPRVISVADGGTFYAQVTATADAPIDEVGVRLVNSAPAGLSGDLSTDAPTGGFTLAGEPTGDCDLGTSDEVTCTFAINVAAGTPEIEDLDGAGDEFAYVFRPYIVVGGERTEPKEYRGYVDIE